MDDFTGDLSRSLVLDGNAAAGLLAEVFGAEMTDRIAQCASCGNTGELGALRAYMRSPGLVLRCPVCDNIVLRMVETPKAVYVDLRGASVMEWRK